MGSWIIGHFCKHCHKEVAYSTKMQNHGVCPHCLAISGDTVVDTYIKLYKDIKTSPWWKFWEVESYRIYAKDEEK